MSLVRALLDHTWRLMTLRHDGRGLPKKRSGLLYMLCALLVISGLTQFFASSFRASVIEYALVYGIMIALTISRPVFLALPCCLASSAICSTSHFIFSWERCRLPSIWQ